MTLYLPKNAVQRRDSVLAVDNMIKSGDAKAALMNLVKKAKAELAGIFVLTAIGDAWQMKMKTEDCSVEILLKA